MGTGMGMRTKIVGTGWGWGQTAGTAEMGPTLWGWCVDGGRNNGDGWGWGQVFVPKYFDMYMFILSRTAR